MKIMNTHTSIHGAEERYMAPTANIITVAVEQGFNISGGGEYPGGETEELFSWDETKGF